MVIWLASPVGAPTLGTVSGTWSNLVGDGGTGTFQTVGVENQVLWGVSAGSGQSGLGFTPNTALPISFPVAVEFEIGTLRHFNNPIFAPAATAVDLTIVLGLTAPAANPSFTFTFSIDETPNVAPCAFPSATPCADKITFPGGLPLSQTFTVSGLQVTLEVVGFKISPGGALLTDFISDEGQTNSVLLFGKITNIVQEIPIDIKPGSDPSSWPCKKVNDGIPVAILSSATFDATSVDADSVRFGVTGAEAAEVHTKGGDAKRHVEDVNKDGLPDMVFHFRFGDTGFSCDDIPEGENKVNVTARLTGSTEDGVSIEGEGTLRLVKE